MNLISVSILYLLYYHAVNSITFEIMNFVICYKEGLYNDSHTYSNEGKAFSEHVTTFSKLYKYIYHMNVHVSWPQLVFIHNYTAWL